MLHNNVCRFDLAFHHMKLLLIYQQIKQAVFETPLLL